jgi:hypothetical protein
MNQTAYKGPAKALIRVREGQDKEVQDMINLAFQPISRNLPGVAGVKTGIGKLNIDVTLPTRNSFQLRTQR